MYSFPEQPQSKAAVMIKAKAHQILEDELTMLQSFFEGTTAGYRGRLRADEIHSRGPGEKDNTQP